MRRQPNSATKIVLPLDISASKLLNSEKETALHLLESPVVISEAPALTGVLLSFLMPDILQKLVDHAVDVFAICRERGKPSVDV